jgi:hypothetical protein
MMGAVTPQEEASLQRVAPKRREELRRAYEDLGRIRDQHPGVDDIDKLQPDDRAEALRTLATIRRLTAGGGVTPATIMSLVLLAAALAFLWFKPTTVYQCRPQEAGVLTCTISERVFGLVPIRSRTIAGIAHVQYGSHVEQSESRENGNVRRSSTTVEAVSFRNASDTELWEESDSHLMGASLKQLAEAAEARTGESAEASPFVLWNLPWPILLLATPFLLLPASHLPATFAVWLRNRGLASAAVYQALYWGPTWAVLLLLAVGWGVNALGGQPPSWLVSMLGLG